MIFRVQFSCGNQLFELFDKFDKIDLRDKRTSYGVAEKVLKVDEGDVGREEPIPLLSKCVFGFDLAFFKDVFRHQRLVRGQIGEKNSNNGHYFVPFVHLRRALDSPI